MDRLETFLADLLIGHQSQHPDPNRDIWAETIAATGYNPDHDH
jgi:hypothetical protein